MSMPEALRNDQVEGVAQDFSGGVAENGLGTVVPDSDRPFAIREDDGIRSLLHDGLKQIEIGMLELVGRLHPDSPFLTVCKKIRRPDYRGAGSGLFALKAGMENVPLNDRCSAR